MKAIPIIFLLSVILAGSGCAWFRPEGKMVEDLGRPLQVPQDTPIATGCASPSVAMHQEEMIYPECASPSVAVQDDDEFNDKCASPSFSTTDSEFETESDWCSLTLLGWQEDRLVFLDGDELYWEPTEQGLTYFLREGEHTLRVELQDTVLLDTVLRLKSGEELQIQIP